MKDIKKLMITLVALLALTTGAWAQPWTSGACTVTFSDGVLTFSGTGAMADYTSNSAPWSDSDIKTIVIESGVTSIGEGAFASCYNLESVSIPASVTSIGARAFEYCGLATTAPTVSFAEGSTPLTIGERAFYYANLKSIDIPNRVTSIGEQAFSGCSSMESVSIPASVTSIREEAFWNCGMLAKVYIFAPSLTTYGDLAFDDNADGRKIHVLSDAVDTYKAGWPAYAADIVGDLQPLASGPKVTWTAATKTGSFTMPGGNVTLEPEYYPQAALTAAPTAINDVPATTDGAIVEAGTVKNIGETTTAQGTVMYYVSPTALDDAALLALAADQWTADVPTAADLAQGPAYVYYYVRGNDSDTDDENFSDGDILAANAVQVTLGAAPLWNAEFDLTNAPEEDKAGKWSTDIPEGGVVKGTEVKVTYTGTKKVIGVKAEKKAAKPAAEGHALSASVVGEIVGSDGNVYAVADKDNLPEGVTAVAMVAYKSATAGSSLAIALADEGSMNWNSAKSTCASKAAIGGKSWKLPTKDEWEQMFSANGGSTGLKTALSAAGGASSTLQNGYYWSSTEVVLDPEDDPDMAWIYSFGEVRWYWDDMVNGRQVRACLAF